MASVRQAIIAVIEQAIFANPRSRQEVGRYADEVLALMGARTGEVDGRVAITKQDGQPLRVETEPLRFAPLTLTPTSSLRERHQLTNALEVSYRNTVHNLPEDVLVALRMVGNPAQFTFADAVAVQVQTIITYDLRAKLQGFTLEQRLDSLRTLRRTWIEQFGLSEDEAAQTSEVQAVDIAIAKIVG